MLSKAKAKLVCVIQPLKTRFSLGACFMKASSGLTLRNGNTGGILFPAIFMNRTVTSCHVLPMSLKHVQKLFLLVYVLWSS